MTDWGVTSAILTGAAISSGYSKKIEEKIEELQEELTIRRLEEEERLQTLSSKLKLEAVSLEPNESKITLTDSFKELVYDYFVKRAENRTLDRFEDFIETYKDSPAGIVQRHLKYKITDKNKILYENQTYTMLTVASPTDSDTFIQIHVNADFYNHAEIGTIVYLMNYTFSENRPIPNFKTEVYNELTRLNIKLTHQREELIHQRQELIHQEEELIHQQKEYKKGNKIFQGQITKKEISEKRIISKYKKYTLYYRICAAVFIISFMLACIFSLVFNSQTNTTNTTYTCTGGGYNTYGVSGGSCTETVIVTIDGVSLVLLIVFWSLFTVSIFLFIFSLIKASKYQKPAKEIKQLKEKINKAEKSIDEIQELLGQNQDAIGQNQDAIDQNQDTVNFNDFIKNLTDKIYQ